jgi:hypothetical protein
VGYRKGDDLMMRTCQALLDALLSVAKNLGPLGYRKGADLVCFGARGWGKSQCSLCGYANSARFFGFGLILTVGVRLEIKQVGVAAFQGQQFLV